MNRCGWTRAQQAPNRARSCNNPAYVSVVTVFLGNWTVSSSIFIIIIVAMVIGGRVMRGRYSAMSRIEVARADTVETAAMTREITEMRARIAVLERIVTENRSSQSLAHEIEALRDR